MFCPKCGTQNPETGKFCRSCGTDLGNVSEALTGNLKPPAALCDRKGRPISFEGAIVKFFTGIAFMAVSIALAFSGTGRGWWFWMLIPAFSMMGTGIAQFIRIKEEQKRNLQAGFPVQPSLSAAPQGTPLPPRRTGELVPPPPSVTEGTTRHLGADAPTRHLDASGESHN